MSRRAPAEATALAAGLFQRNGPTVTIRPQDSMRSISPSGNSSYRPAVAYVTRLRRQYVAAAHLDLRLQQMFKLMVIRRGKDIALFGRRCWAASICAGSRTGSDFYLFRRAVRRRNGATIEESSSAVRSPHTSQCQYCSRAQLNTTGWAIVH